MFSNKPNYVKLRTNLRLCINRLKLLEKKKTELALKARREIADYITAGKEDRARIRVEHIIREDYLVEAMEIVEMLCDLLLARFGLIEKMAELDPGLEEAISTIIWVTPRMMGDVQELREVTQQLALKYGKEYTDMCRRNGFENVNEKVLHKMNLAAPPKLLVENYMIEIAKTYKVPFEPDPVVMMGHPPETSDLIELGVHADSVTVNSIGNSPSHSSAAAIAKQHEVEGRSNVANKPFNYYNNKGGGGVLMPTPSTISSSNADANHYEGGNMYAPASAATPSSRNFDGSENNYEEVIFDGSHANLANFGSAGGCSTSVTGSHGGIVGGVQSGAGSGLAGDGSEFGVPCYRNPLAGGVPVLPSSNASSFPSHVRPDIYGPGIYSDAVSQQPPSNNMPPRGMPTPPSRPPNAGHMQPPNSGSNNQNALPSLPPYDDVMRAPGQYPPSVNSNSSLPGRGGGGPVPAPRNTGPELPDIPTLPDVPGLPSVPTNSIGGASVGGDNVDFDDLARRFEELKRRK